MTYPIQLQSRNVAAPLAWTVLAVWFLLALAGSIAGVFQSGNRPPLALGLAAGVPVVLFAIAFWSWAAFRSFVAGINPRMLTAAQSLRVIGIVFVILYYRGLLPRTFALSAGYGDIAIGITAPLIAWAMASPSSLRRQIAVLWNAMGIADLVLAVTLGVLSSATPIGFLSAGASTQMMGSFPMSIIPTFLVPLFLIFHLITLRHLRQKG